MEQIILTTDIAVTINKEKILLIKRTKEPFMNKLVLPGGHVEIEDENVSHACARELFEEVGLDIDPQNLKLLTVLDAKNRDPRPDWRVSITYTIDISEEKYTQCHAGSDAKEIIVKFISELTEGEIGFDHFEIIKMLR